MERRTFGSRWLIEGGVMLPNRARWSEGEAALARLEWPRSLPGASERVFAKSEGTPVEQDLTVERSCRADEGANERDLTVERSHLVDEDDLDERRLHIRSASLHRRHVRRVQRASFRQLARGIRDALTEQP